MRHGKAGRRLGRTGAHRTALFRNLVAALIRHERIRTTDAKAKELRGIADRMVTLGKEGTLHARRRAFDKLRNREAVQKLFDEIAPRFAKRPGGYTRVIKIGWRPGDAAPVSLIEWSAAKEEAKKAQPKKRQPARAASKGDAKAEPASRRKKAAAG